MRDGEEGVAQMEIDVKIEGETLVIRIPMQKPTRSGSGKTLVVASSHGNIKTDILVEGRPLTVGVNAYISKK